MPANPRPPRRTRPLWAFALALLLVGHTAQAGEKDLGQFGDAKEAAKLWVAVNDTVMGGVSKGSARLNADGHLVFFGELSLKNNGGFASIRTRNQDNLLAGNDTLNVRLKGDGRTYYLSLRDKDRAMAASHRFPIKTVKGKWIDVSADLSDFNYTVFGRNIDKGELKSDQIVGIGFTLADKNEGPFKLEVASITASDGKPSRDTQHTETVATTGNIVDIATQAGQFNTLLAAAKAAGLVDALKNPDANLTVFAPTDKAFAALPKGTVASLLEPENRDKLVAILTYHVLPNKVTLNQTVKTLQGNTLEIKAVGKITVGEATVRKADIQASNGVIHVIDRVLLPAMPEPTPQDKAMEVIELAIDRGVPIYNNGSPAACAAIYEVAATSLLNGHGDALTKTDKNALMKTLKAIRNGHSASDQAWALRETLDRVYASLSKRAD